MTGFSWPAEAMGSCWSCLYRDPIRDNHLTKFKVNCKIIFIIIIIAFTASTLLGVLYCNILIYSVACLFPCCRSLTWMMRATSWALESWSSPKLSSFFTQGRGTPSGGHISACDATATTPTCSRLRAVVAVRLDRVSIYSYLN